VRTNRLTAELIVTTVRGETLVERKRELTEVAARLSAVVRGLARR
tara:strand:+ start:148 stop:282 length:135 start_codon:yes stop_codon:yes gene_type:complete